MVFFRALCAFRAFRGADSRRLPDTPLSPSRTGGNLLFDPPADDVEHLAAVVLEHHEVAVAEDPAIPQLQILRVAAGRLHELHGGRTLRSSRPLGPCLPH